MPAADPRRPLQLRRAILLTRSALPSQRKVSSHSTYYDVLIGIIFRRGPESRGPWRSGDHTVE